MKRICIVFLFSVGSVSSNAQYNLVPNPGFEIFDTCPNGYGQISNATGWTNPMHFTSPDYFNACVTTTNALSVPSNYYGNESAHGGVAYAGIVTYTFNYLVNHATNGREYLQTQLTDSLITGVDYCIRFYVSAADSMRWVSNNIGVYFSQTEVYDTCTPGSCVLQLTPQFENPLTNNLNSRIGWTEVSGTYTAAGGERFIIIGNFRDTAATTATLTGWSANVYIYSGAFYYIDDVLVTPCDSLTDIYDIKIESEVSIYPNPSSGKYTLNVGELNVTGVKLFDALGRMHNYTYAIRNSEIIIDIESQSNGIYFIQVLTKSKLFKIKVVKN